MKQQITYLKNNLDNVDLSIQVRKDNSENPMLEINYKENAYIFIY